MKYGNIFAKVLTVMSVVLAAVIVASYALIYCLLPGFYRNHESRRYGEIVDEVIEELCGPDNSAEEMEKLIEFAQKYGVDMILYNGSGEIVFDYHRDYSVTIDMEVNENGNNISAGVNTGETGKDSEEISLTRTYEWNGGERTLKVLISLEQLDEAKAVIVEIYPIAFACCLVLAVLAAAIISNLFVKPIRRMNDSVRKMAEMDPDACAPVGSQDEIGELGRNVNLLYQRLRGTIESLGQELTKNQNAENQKIDFLRTVSHELKNPLAAANALVEGMLYEIPPYDSSQKEYLQQCKGFLERAGELARESLQFSKFMGKEEVSDVKLKDRISSVVSEYKLLLNAKQIQYREEIPETLTIHTNDKLFSKVISNLISNAVHYTPKRGRIHIYTVVDGGEKVTLLIENSCEPLSADVLGELFEKPYKRSDRNPDSTGLGLYIVNQILNILHMRYCFAPLEESGGMVFRIEERSRKLSSE